jgi:pimeloyl-ACP methyl ester carboxylesterase
MPTVRTADGVALYFEEAGDGAPLVFAHEFGGDHRSWEAQLRRFSRQYRCIAYCARGYPPSDVPDRPEAYSQEFHREDLRALIEGLRLDRPHVVGLSMGGYAALHLAMAYCARGQVPLARSLVVASVGNGAHPAQREVFQRSTREWAAGIRARGMAEFAAAFARGATRRQLLHKDPRGFAEHERRLAGRSAVGAAFSLEHVLAERPSLFDLVLPLSRIDVPVLVLVGDEDEPCVEPSLLVRRTIPRAGLAMLPRSGHLLNLEEPELFDGLIAGFLDRVERGAWG